jgi:hypothetical protein
MTPEAPGPNLTAMLRISRLQARTGALLVALAVALSACSAHDVTVREGNQSDQAERSINRPWSDKELSGAHLAQLVTRSLVATHSPRVVRHP